MQMSFVMTSEKYKLYFCQRKHIIVFWCQSENIIKSREYNVILLKALTPI